MKILSQKQLKSLVAIGLVLAFVLLAMNVLLPNGKNLVNKGTIATNDNNNNQSNATINKDSQETDYEEKQKTDLKNILKKMNGVGDVDVMITFENGEEKVPAYDKNSQTSTTEETDTEGGKRTNNQNTDGTKVVMTSDEGNNKPFILTTYKPKIIGAVVVAEGAENSKTKYEIEQAVSKLFNLSLDRVNVYSMKN